MSDTSRTPRFPRVKLCSRVAGGPAEVLFRSAWLLDPRAGLDEPSDLRVSAGEIAEIGAPGSLQPAAGTEVVEAGGLHVFPGFVDPHVHLRSPGREDEEDLESGTRAAAAGGFCCVLAMPNTDPVVDRAPVLRSLQERASREALVPVGFLASITRGLAGAELSEMLELVQEGAAGFTDDGVPVADAGRMRQALQYQRLAGAVLALHEEVPELSGAGVMHEGAVSTLLGLAGIPSISESVAIDRDVALAGYEGGRIHILHVSAAESVAAIAHARDRGVEVTAEVTPHHLTLTDDLIRSGAQPPGDVSGERRPQGMGIPPLDPRFKMNPPLRAEQDRQALIEGLRSGVLECVATDHAPHSREEKEEPFERAPMGVTGLETAFAALHTELVRPGVIPLPLLVERMSAGGRPYGLAAPTLGKGSPANLCLVDLDSKWTVGESGYESRSENSCFAGRELQGRVLMTLAAGSIAWRERSFAIRPAAGDGVAGRVAVRGGAA